MPMEPVIHSFITLVGTLSVTEDGEGRITAVYLPSDNLPCMREDATPTLLEAERQITEYLCGQRREFDLPLNTEGLSEFATKVLKEISKIPYGETITYSELAKRCGSPNAFRAAGTACGKNPIPIIIPCHRVVPSSGGVGSYAGGSAMKKRLLDLEKGML